MSKVVYNKSTQVKPRSGMSAYDVAVAEAKVIIAQHPEWKTLHSSFHFTEFSKTGNSYYTLRITDRDAVNWPNMIWFLICLGILITLFVVGMR